MKINDQNWKFGRVLKSFFPLHLLISHLKHNIVSLLVWLTFFLIISDKFGSSFGVPYLFLSPEYLGSVSPLSFLLLGFAFGGFMMGFNTYSYMKVGAHYPFLTTLARPFLKFCVNNSLIPIAFFITHSILIWRFQTNEELVDKTTILLFILSYLFGIVIFILLSILYFFPMSRRNKTYDEHAKTPLQSMIMRKGNWYSVFSKQKDLQFLYLGKGLKLMISRSTEHFDRELFERVFAKNRINASLYEILTIIIFFLLGFLNSYKIFEVPAATSIVLLFTILQMIFSALHAWLREWTYPFILVTILIMNALSLQTGLFDYTSYAYGLNYNKNAAYSFNNIKKTHRPSLTQESLEDYIKTLENWKRNTGEKRPKLIIVNTSGGGSRSALWTMVVLQELNELTQGASNKHIQMITGASGGMIGAAYYRSLLIEANKDSNINLSAQQYRDNMGKDILNKMSFMASTNDIFIRYRKCTVNGHQYTMDRGYGFEKQLNENIDNLFDHKLSYFEPYERAGIIPTMVFSPTIVNDGRRMLIGSQKLSFMSTSKESEKGNQKLYENIDFQSFFGAKAAEDIKFTSVLRASATFPFVMPMITLPTKPEILLMDAGIRDNYGTKNTLLYLNKLEEWIAKNTSGVILIQIRDTKKVMENDDVEAVSFLTKITLPFGNMYKNFPRVQSFNQEEMIDYAKDEFPFRMNVLTFNLMESKKERIALSWHLTQKEKNKVEAALDTKYNQYALKQLIQLLK